jgi:DNA-binding GntR family transcriptional regulator
LRSAIENGSLKPGQPLTSQAQLARRHGVALGTLHQVLGLLEHEGYIMRRQGVGTFVADAPPAPDSPLRALAQWTAQDFASAHAAVTSALAFLARQIGMHSAFLSRIQTDQLAIVADYDDNGCGIRAGTAFPLDDAF